MDLYTPQRLYTCERLHIFQKLHTFHETHTFRPSCIAAIDMAGAFESFPKLVPRSISIALWDTLLDNPADGFVVYVESANLLIKVPEDTHPSFQN